jgi:two-component system chemotaxis response regulator CheY
MTDRANPRILVIEDDADLLTELHEMLRRDGYEVQWARNGEVGLELTRKTRPDMVCVDLTLPKLSGFDVCESVRADPTIAATPIVVISARHTPVVRAQAADCGADGYVAKPFDKQSLLAEIGRVFAQRSGNAPSPQSPRRSPLSFTTSVGSLLRAARIRRII